jgi:hypothetical protein
MPSHNRLPEEAARVARETNAGPLLRVTVTTYEFGPAPQPVAAPFDPHRPEDSPAERAVIAAILAAGRPLRRDATAEAASLEPDGNSFKHAFARLRRADRIYRPAPAVAAYWVRGVPEPPDSGAQSGHHAPN